MFKITVKFSFSLTFNGSSKNGVWWLRSKIWGPYDIYDSDKWAFDGWQAFKAWRLMTDYKCR